MFITSHSFSGLLDLQIPGPYVLLERHIRHIRHERPTLSWEEFSSLCREYSLASDAALKAARFFHEVGELLYFGDSQRNLSDLVILNAQWLARVMSSLVSFRTQQSISAGVVPFKRLCQIWHEFSDDTKMKLLHLLEKFEIAYQMRPPYARDERSNATPCDYKCSGDSTPISSSSTSSSVILLEDQHDVIIPSLLPEDPPDPSEILRVWPPMDRIKCGFSEFRRIYEFGFLPLGLFGRIVVRILHLPDVIAPVIWRTGLILRSKQNEGIHSFCSLQTNSLFPPLFFFSHMFLILIYFFFSLSLSFSQAHSFNFKQVRTNSSSSIDRIMRGVGHQGLRSFFSSFSRLIRCWMVTITAYFTPFGRSFPVVTASQKMNQRRLYSPLRSVPWQCGVTIRMSDAGTFLLMLRTSHPI